MKVVKFAEEGRKKVLYLDGKRYRKVPNQDKFEVGTVYITHKGETYIEENL